MKSFAPAASIVCSDQNFAISVGNGEHEAILAVNPSTVRLHAPCARDKGDPLRAC